MRSYEEIKADINRAQSINDVSALRDLSAEMQALGTSEAEASASNAQGKAATLTGDYPLALEHFRRALALHEELGDRFGVARVTGDLGNVYYRTGDSPQALEHFRRSLALHEELGDRFGVAAVTGNMGNVYFDTGDYPQALERWRRALAMFEELGNLRNVAVLTGNIGNVYMSTGDYPQALEQYDRALAAHEELGDRFNSALVTGNMGNVYQSTGDDRQALEHYNRALAAHEELGDRAGVARITGNMGSVYQSTGDYPQALAHFRRALAILEELGNRRDVARVTIDMVSTLMRLDRHDEAAKLLEHQATLPLDNPNIRAGHQANRARLAEYHNDLEAAQRYFMEALAITTEAGLRSLSANYHVKLRDLAQKRNDFEAYIHHNNDYLRITEEIRGKEATQKMAMMEAERRIEGERREREKERALLYGALPKSVADRKLRGEDVSGDHFENVSVIFLDIAGFTAISDRIPPGHVVHLLEQIFSALDDVCAEHGVTKIKTIGDSYLAVAGVPEPLDDHVQRAAACATDMLKIMNTLQVTMPPELGDTSWVDQVGEINVRIGVHSGPVTAGVIGKDRLQYDVWGDTVNVASRMESTGEPGRIQVSSAFAEQLRLASAEKEGTANSNSQRQLTERGTIEVKGKGTMTTYWLESA